MELYTIQKPERTLSQPHLTEVDLLRIRILLAFQRALLGEVPPSLVAVGVTWGESTIEGRFYYETNPNENEVERVSELETELIAGFPKHKVIFRALPNLMERERTELMELVYQRAE